MNSNKPELPKVNTSIYDWDDTTIYDTTDVYELYKNDDEWNNIVKFTQKLFVKK